MARPLRTLLFSTLYPNAIRPGHGIFVETRLRQLLALGGVEARVLAPVPWFPFAHPRFGEYAQFARVPASEVRHGIPVDHPRYVQLPRIGMTLAPFALAAGALPFARRMLRSGFEFDLIDAHYFYPDGVAAALLGRVLGKPVVITARGSDVNVLPRFPVPRRLIRWAASSCAAIVAVAGALKRSLITLGVEERKVVVLRNGVDLEVFYPEPRAAAREKFGVSGFCVACVANLVPLKGIDLVLEAMRDLPEATLLLAGSGPEEKSLRNRADALGVSGRVKFLGRLPQEQLRALYGAADVLVLASTSEGWANVLLESMACGTPVIATPVGGSPEIVAGPAAGMLLEERTVAALLKALRQVRDATPDRAATRRYAEGFGWLPTSHGQVDLFRSIIAGRSI
ncbi:MAG: glycosyltransferase family 4 protein [Burkholderiales bacterium]|nr:glycosyltransferase family 4 protein [Burkholderiales bacterium]